MELQKFITAAIKAIGNGVQAGKEGKIKPYLEPATSNKNGVEFDLCVLPKSDGTIDVRYDSHEGVHLATRIKFSMSIAISD